MTFEKFFAVRSSLEQAMFMVIDQPVRVTNSQGRGRSFQLGALAILKLPDEEDEYIFGLAVQESAGEKQYCPVVLYLGSNEVSDNPTDNWIEDIMGFLYPWVRECLASQPVIFLQLGIRLGRAING
jgi:hypothetical protein